MVVKHNQPITEAIIITKIYKIQEALFNVGLYVNCLTEVTDWYGKNQLLLNTEKSEAVIFLTSKQPNDLVSDISVTIGGHRVVPNPSVRNLGGAVIARQSAGLSIEGTVVQSHLPPFRNLGNFFTTFACVFRKRH